jgi:hypothetical protein
VTAAERDAFDEWELGERRFTLRMELLGFFKPAVNDGQRNNLLNPPLVGPEPT